MEGSESGALARSNTILEVELSEQGLCSFDIWDLLQILSSLVWILAATYHDQLVVGFLGLLPGCFSWSGS